MPFLRKGRLRIRWLLACLLVVGCGSGQISGPDAGDDAGPDGGDEGSAGDEAVGDGGDGGAVGDEVGGDSGDDGDGGDDGAAGDDLVWDGGDDGAAGDAPDGSMDAGTDESQVCDPGHPEGTCPAGQFCSAAGRCVDLGFCAVDADCPARRVCHGGACVEPSAGYSGAGPDHLGLNAACQWYLDWGGDQAFSDCELGLVLAKNLGIGWIRWGVPWYFLADAQGQIAPGQLVFVERFLRAARQRGMKVLLQVVPDAPPAAYRPPRAFPSSQLSFDDAAFDAWIDAVLEVARPYTAYFELFNEVNLSCEGTDVTSATEVRRYWIEQESSPADDPKSRLVERVGHYYNRFRARMQAASAIHPDFAPVLLSSGLSHYRLSTPPELADVWDTEPAGCMGTICNLYLFGAREFVSRLGAAGLLRNAIDVVSFHPYFQTDLDWMTDEIQTIRSAVNGAPGGAGLPLWVTETGWHPAWEGSSNQGVDFLERVLQQVDGGALQKVFYFTIRTWDDTDPGSDAVNYGLYAKDGWSLNPSKVQAATALFERARRASFDSRFDPPPPGAPTLLDLLAEAPGAVWIQAAGANVVPITFGGPGSRAAPSALEAEDGSSSPALRVTLDDTVDLVEGSFRDIQVPATGIPTLRLSFGFAASAPPAARAQFEIWIIGGNWPGHQRLFPYLKAKTGSLETVEIDLSQVRGTTIYLNLRAVRSGSLGAGVSADLLWAGARIIDRRS